MLTLAVITIYIAAVVFVFGWLIPDALSATKAQLSSRQARQQATIRRYTGTVVFFARRPVLARSAAGREALRRAHVWLTVARRELAETRAELRSKRRQPVRSLQSSTTSSWLVDAFLCIHSHEGAWNAATGNGYYGGLQMDYGFMSSYGPELLAVKGPASNWTPAEQIMVAVRAYSSGRGFGPWPNTRRMCGV